MEKKILSSRYELEEQVEQGGMSTVYKAHDNILNRTVAVKVLKKEFYNNQDFLVKFNNEAKAAASLNHPNIVNVYDVGKDEDAAYIVMEYVDGINLKKLIKGKGRLTESEAINILTQTCYALREAHNHGIIHRDVKPHNIMITNDGKVKVGDFGIAKATSSATITAVGEVLGSVHYFSPEQARSAYMDNRSDIYSLGIVLYEMLIGTTPYDGDTPVNVALKHINSTVRIPEEFKEKISLPLQNMILKMTNKDMDSRYNNIDEILKDIDSINAGKQIQNYSLENEDEFETKIIKMPKKYTTPNKKTVKKSNSKKLNVKNIAIASALVIALVFLLFNAESLYDMAFDNKTVVVPNIIDMKEEDAKKTLEDIGLKLKVTDIKDSDKEENTIIYQNPSDGVSIRKGEEIVAMLSNGLKQNFGAPELVNLDVNEAKGKLEKLGISAEVEYEFSNDVNKDIVISQSVKAGEKLKKGETILLKVSKGKDENLTNVPNFIGLTVEQAKERLDGFTLGNVSYKQDTTKQDGIILVQNPEKDSSAPKGSSIDVIVNKLDENKGNSGQYDPTLNVQDLPKTVSKEITLILPQKEYIKLTLIEKSTGVVAYSTNVSTLQSPNYNVQLSSERGTSKQYDIYIDDAYYSSTSVIDF
ncbi:Stk1 family PASTA domain-containing Ser/Thr kinase [Criibacterium bergeronii]|uniref:non-specific serine/threonine protein kinase n=1 Tax=Criibacterium bergeronii TaxID=1871336 RepID=A0A371INA3_9FIRM|nr:Stk1 family PASTA domain-containing Ser/Thr kinase [Criibacterium bergeronii]MBS6062614.1 Stk1 family PASTA domain-containing Ser/Thr kinase [Peptostreptococcaceae bacterium]RDY21969.1 Stk1 family PASTA domain-containing Ser/Thr kinase [Criibacterium bergeronii]